MQLPTKEIVNLKIVFTRYLKTESTASINLLVLYNHSPTVGLPLQKPV